MPNNSQWRLYAEKADLKDIRDYDIKHERFVRMEINIVLGNNGGYMPSILVGRWSDS